MLLFGIKKNVMENIEGKELRRNKKNKKDKGGQKALEKEKKCSCRFRNCKRHGKCEECIAHHKKHPKHPLPSCQRRKKPE